MSDMNAFDAQNFSLITDHVKPERKSIGNVCPFVHRLTTLSLEPTDF